MLFSKFANKRKAEGDIKKLRDMDSSTKLCVRTEPAWPVNTWISVSNLTVAPLLLCLHANCVFSYHQASMSCWMSLVFVMGILFIHSTNNRKIKNRNRYWHSLFHYRWVIHLSFSRKALKQLVVWTPLTLLLLKYIILKLLRMHDETLKCHLEIIVFFHNVMQLQYSMIMHPKAISLNKVISETVI